MDKACNSRILVTQVSIVKYYLSCLVTNSSMLFTGIQCTGDLSWAMEWWEASLPRWHSRWLSRLYITGFLIWSIHWFYWYITTFNWGVLTHGHCELFGLLGRKVAALKETCSNLWLQDSILLKLLENNFFISIIFFPF